MERKSLLRDYPQGPFVKLNQQLRFPEKRVFDQEEELEKYKRGETQFDQHESVNYPAFDILHEARHCLWFDGAGAR